MRREQTCAVETSDRTGGVPALVRDALVRPEVRREGGVAAVHRPRPDLRARRLQRPTVRSPDVNVPALISSEVVAPEQVSVLSTLDASQGTAVVETPGRTSYTASADVLFDPGEATLRPDAIPALQSIVTAIQAAPPDTALLVEGHTDSLGETAYNDALGWPGPRVSPTGWWPRAVSIRRGSRRRASARARRSPPTRSLTGATTPRDGP